MIYLSTNSDGNSTEGIGAMVQYQLFCYCLARHLNVEYTFSGFKNLNHWQYYGIEQNKFIDDVNNFFNIPSSQNKLPDDIEKITFHSIDQNLFQLIKSNRTVLIELTPHILMQYGQGNIIEIEKNRWIKDLQKYINPNLTDELNKESDFNIAVHIRKYTQTDCDPASVRDLYDVSKSQYYINLINDLTSLYADRQPRIHIFSQGHESDFKFLNDFKNVNLHIEEYPLISLYSMIKSDIFVMANSSLSYVASLYRDKCTYKKFNFYHETYRQNVNLISPTGKII
jgi:hypothetical protein